MEIFAYAWSSFSHGIHELKGHFLKGTISGKFIELCMYSFIYCLIAEDGHANNPPDRKWELSRFVSFQCAPLAPAVPMLQARPLHLFQKAISFFCFSSSSKNKTKTERAPDAPPPPKRRSNNKFNSSAQDSRGGVVKLRRRLSPGR